GILVVCKRNKYPNKKDKIKYCRQIPITTMFPVFLPPNEFAGTARFISKRYPHQTDCGRNFIARTEITGYATQPERVFTQLYCNRGMATQRRQPRFYS